MLFLLVIAATLGVGWAVAALAGYWFATAGLLAFEAFVMVLVVLGYGLFRLAGGRSRLEVARDNAAAVFRAKMPGAPVDRHGIPTVPADEWP
jgi:hypothetical protein